MYINNKMLRLLFLLLTTTVLLLVTPTARAQESSPSASITPEATVTPTPEYALPYPGLMPDSPLYFLKVTRDRIISFLIADPLKKSEFNLLQADKRLGAGDYLIQKNNYDLAESTFSKGLNYMEESLDRLEEAKKEGRDVKPMSERIRASLKKHQETFAELNPKATGDFKQHVVQLLKRVEKYNQRVDKIVPAK